MGFQSIKSILPSSIKSAGITKQVKALNVVEAARAVIDREWGREKAAYLDVLSFRDGVLKIQSRSGVALQALGIDKVRILSEINRQLGGKIVSDILTRMI